LALTNSSHIENRFINCFPSPTLKHKKNLHKFFVSVFGGTHEEKEFLNKRFKTLALFFSPPLLIPMGYFRAIFIYLFIFFFFLFIGFEVLCPLLPSRSNI